MHAINVSQFSVSWILILCLHQTRLKAPSTATGCTASSGTRPPAHVTGPAGTAPPPSSSASAACSTTRRLTPATGLRTLRGARSTLSARMTPMETFHWGNPATVTGRARVATRVSSAAPPCWCSTRTAGAASPRPPRTARFPPPRRRRRARRTTSTPGRADGARRECSSLPTRAAAAAGGGPSSSRPSQPGGLSQSRSLSTFRQARSRSARETKSTTDTGHILLFSQSI